MSRPLRILHIEDNPDDRALIQRELRRKYADLQVTPIQNATDFARALEEDEAYDLVLTDFHIGWTDGMAILRAVKDRCPDCPVIMVTGTGSEEIAVESKKARFNDHALKAAKNFGRLAVGEKGVMEGAQERRALGESEDRFHAFMDNSPAVAFMKDEDGRFVYVNQLFERFFKLTRLQWMGKTDFDLWPEETARQLRDNDRAILAEDRPAEIFETFPGPDGILRNWLVFKFPVKDHAGRRFLGGMAVDITERRHLGQQLRQALKMETIGKLAGGVAHDFNNLVTIITGDSDMVLSRIGPEDPMRRDIEQIKKAGDRAHSLTRQLLAFSRRQMLQPKVLDLNAVVSNLEPMLHRLIGENIELAIVLKPGLGQVKADPGQLEQVLMNLTINARDAMPHGGKLLFETDNATLDEVYARQHIPTQPGSYVRLAVSDTGCGMDEATQSRIFEPFFTTKEQGKGTGLGLSTVYGIVKQHDGYIAVDSEVGRGTTFTIYLPRVEDAVEPVVGGAGPDGSPRGEETILLVEDEGDVRELAREILEKSGYAVLEAANGPDALRIAARHEGVIHLLLTDVVMPQMSGRELARRLVRTRPEVRVLYTSGYIDENMMRRSVVDQDTALLKKPFSSDALVRRVREVLDGRPPVR